MPVIVAAKRAPSMLAARHGARRSSLARRLTIDAAGVAPHAIEWRLGVRPGAPPFLDCVGDRYRRPDELAAAI